MQAATTGMKRMAGSLHYIVSTKSGQYAYERVGQRDARISPRGTPRNSLVKQLIGALARVAVPRAKTNWVARRP